MNLGRSTSMNSRHAVVFCLAVLLLRPTLRAQAEDLSCAVSPEKLREIQEAVDRGLELLSNHQNENGSFQGGDGPHSYSTCDAPRVFRLFQQLQITPLSLRHRIVPSRGELWGQSLFFWFLGFKTNFDPVDPPHVSRRVSC
jgi:hypothetical protein